MTAAYTTYIHAEVNVFFNYRSHSFVWDSDKEFANYRKHRIRFEIAVQVLFDPLVANFDVTADDERRTASIGTVKNGGAVLWVVHTEREGDVTRIISARHATKREQQDYEDNG